MKSTKRSQFQNSEERQMRESGEPEALAARSQSGDVDLPQRNGSHSSTAYSRHSWEAESLPITRA